MFTDWNKGSFAVEKAIDNLTKISKKIGEVDLEITQTRVKVFDHELDEEEIVRANEKLGGLVYSRSLLESMKQDAERTLKYSFEWLYA